MRITEAYKVLDVSPDISPEDLKKKYRELSKKYHPDLNKDPEAEDKFKKINEAYTLIQKGEEEESMDFNPFSPFGSMFQRNTKIRQGSNIVISIDINFAESVLGTKKEISFHRKGKCDDCNGQGHSNIDNGCEKCKGKGQVTTRQDNMIFVQTCNKCMGRTKTKQCQSCNSSGTVESDVSLNVTIPGGVVEGNILRLAGMGNYLGTTSMGFMSEDRFTDVHLHIHVTAEEGLRLEGDTVISTLNISLLEALQGCRKTVKTVIGEKEVIVNPLSKNNEEIIIPRAGVKGLGNQKVILDVAYPKDTAKLISALTEV